MRRPKVPIPAALSRTAGAWWGDEGAAWLEALPAVVGRLAEAWSLDLGAPFEPGGNTSWAAPAGDAVLKVPLPGRESRWEAAALALYDGDGAVRLLAFDEPSGAMLLERLAPGEPLVDEAEGPVRDWVPVLCGLMRRLWRPVSSDAPFETVGALTADWAPLLLARWAAYGRPCPQALAERAAELLLELPASTDEHLLLHQDLHPANVLAAQREPWLVIDPKPVVGDPAYDTVQAVVRHLTPASGAADRVAQVVDLTGLDHERVRAWAFARCVESGLWSLSVGDHHFAALELRRAELLS